MHVSYHRKKSYVYDAQYLYAVRRSVWMQLGKKHTHTHTKPKQLEIRTCKAFTVQPCTSFVEHSASHLINTSLPTLDNLHPTPSGRYVLPLFILVSKWLVTPISKSVRPFGRGLTTLILRGTYILTMVPHTSNGRQISHLFRRIFGTRFHLEPKDRRPPKNQWRWYLCHAGKSSWSLNHPFVKMGSSSPNRGENKNKMKPPPPRKCL